MHEVIVSLPDIELDDLVPACEVLCQEGFRLWSVTVARLDDLAGLLRLFGRRAKVGVHDVTEPDQVVAAAAAGAVAVWPSGLVTATLASSESLDGLRVTLQQWRLHD